MKELYPREDIPEFVYNSDHWDGHEPNDGCEQNQRAPGFFEGSRIKSESKKRLNNFLTYANREPIRTFQLGEDFDASTYPEGTIIHFNEESLTTDDFYTFPYKDTSFWGVIMKARLEDNETLTTIQKFKPSTSIRFTNPFGELLSTSFIIGDANHVKDFDIYNKPIDIFERIRSLRLYELGKALPEREKGRILLPNLGRFLNPNPGAA